MTEATWTAETDAKALRLQRAHQALEHLMDHYEMRLYNYLSVLLGQQSIVQDCTQDTFLRAFELLYKGKTVNARWLYMVARHRAVDELRHRGRVQYDTEVLLEVPSSEGPANETIVRLLKQLSSADRELLYLFDIDDLDAATIGRLLGIRPGTVRTRVFRAREKLRQLYVERDGMI